MITSAASIPFEVDFNGHLYQGDVRGRFPITEYETYDVIFQDGTIKHLEPIPYAEGYAWFTLSADWQPLLSRIGQTVEQIVA